MAGCGYELACHLTRLYPPWWEGRRFGTPISVWAAGDTYETTRDIIQLTLLGEITYRKGRKAFQGTGRHVIWFDEEPPMDVYNEALIRTATVNGIVLVLVTFTPLLGLSEVVRSLLSVDQRPATEN